MVTIILWNDFTHSYTHALIIILIGSNTCGNVRLYAQLIIIMHTFMLEYCEIIHDNV